jgi:hypothetical protein
MLQFVSMSLISFIIALVIVFLLNGFDDWIIWALELLW